MSRVSFFFIFILCLLTSVTVAHTIKHIIVLMEENRSFDHLLGWRKGVNGLQPSECNDVSIRNPSDGKICVSQQAHNIAECDPDHDFPPTSVKIFGYPAVSKDNFSDPKMDGFVSFERYRGNWTKKSNYCGVMDMFSTEHLPVMNALADNFVLMDEFFASFPGPTWPNRIFFLAATSGGLTETSNPWFKGKTGQLFPQRTIFDQVKKAGLTWKNYVNDTPWELMMESIAHHTENVVLLEELFKDAKEGTLPNFAFINPRAGVNVSTGLGSTDMHPNHDVALGEMYYKDIYEALRASPQWNDTLFIVTFDEHGGFYDHVPTPLNIPSPGDGIKSYPDDFDFKRSGIRIPTLLISPWVTKGKVESKPPKSSMPAGNSEYELTSIMATARKILGIQEGSLTDRDAWAATFEHLLSEATPRTDTPKHLPAARKPALPPQREAMKPLNGLQRHMAKVQAYLSEQPLPTHIETQGEISQWLQDSFHKHHVKTQKWKKSKLTAENDYVVRCEPLIGMNPKFLSSNWTVNTGGSPSFNIISISIPPKNTQRQILNHVNTKGKTTDDNIPLKSKDDQPEVYCLDTTSNVSAGTEVQVSLCYPSADPSKNRDPQQHWIFSSATNTIHPYSDPSICVTNTCVAGADQGELQTPITLQKCDGSLEQRWGYQGGAPGNEGWSNEGLISEGDAIFSMVLDVKNGGEESLKII